MRKGLEAYKFNINLKLPAEEKKAEYDLRVAKAAAKIISELLSPEKINQLIESYKNEKIK